MPTVSRRSVRWRRGGTALRGRALRPEPLRAHQRPHAAVLSAAWPEALYRLTLYTRPELAFRLGDRVEVTDEGGSVWMGRASDSFRYDQLGIA